MASKKDNKRLTAKTLIDKGKKQGSLTLSEIMEAFSETELDKDQSRKPLRNTWKFGNRNNRR